MNYDMCDTQHAHNFTIEVSMLHSLLQKNKDERLLQLVELILHHGSISLDDSVSELILHHRSISLGHSKLLL